MTIGSFSYIIQIRISTHTLTWSVTVFGKKAYKPRKYFNSHAHVERDVFGKKAYKPRKYFNSHAHVERDYHFSTLALYHANFNSHAHVERDT